MPRGRVSSLSQAQQDELRHRFSEREPVSSLAKAYGLSGSSVYNIIRGRRSRQVKPQVRAYLVQRDYMTAGDAAAELGISRFTMHEYLKAGKFPDAFQIGERGRFWLVPRAAVAARKEKLNK